MSTTVALLMTLISLLLMLISSTATDAAHSPLVGGWSPIKDLKDPYILQIAEFAVAEQNKKINGGKLKLAGVVSGESQVVAGMNYRLVLEVKGGATGVHRYEAVVWDKSWEKFRQLISFKPVKA